MNHWGLCAKCSDVVVKASEPNNIPTNIVCEKCFPKSDFYMIRLLENYELLLTTVKFYASVDDARAVNCLRSLWPLNEVKSNREGNREGNT